MGEKENGCGQRRERAEVLASRSKMWLVTHVSEARSQQGYLEQADECRTKQSLIINPFAIFWVPWAGERKEH